VLCVVGAVRSTDAPGAILYGAPGTPCFAPFHSLLRDAPGVGYALRPVLRRGCAGSGCTGLGDGSQADDQRMTMLPLAGYGVSLDVKNPNPNPNPNPNLSLSPNPNPNPGTA